ncbi:hypothetical protein F0562_013943 [Nyssa sinensis]|uniref:DC-UbP/UBTD2 N-terminal domain-containing protein n=1 Tax=Nyssa sinensis TaxID=561372 RepID=A0A5J4ZQ94_9ASTE|nr:hypothetical protein F0562_013943 [Nyssa sinensis]
MTLLNATLSQTALSHVIGYSTSREAWLALERRFSTSTRSNILQLKSALHNISKGKDSIDLYIQKIKQARDSLASVSVLIEDEDILIYVLNGLPQEYNAFKTSIRTRSEHITLEKVYAMLKIEEQTIESVHKQNHTSPFPGAMMASNYRPTFSSNRGYSPFNSSSRGRGRGRLNNRGGRMNSFGKFHSPNFGQSNPLFSPKQPQQSNQRSNNSQPVVCQICNKNGHSALDCYHRLDFSYQGKHPSPQLIAMSAAYNTSYDSSLTNPNYWYTDTGATNHITADLANLNSPIEYQGDDNIIVANGQALDISHSVTGNFSGEHRRHSASLFDCVRLVAMGCTGSSLAKGDASTMKIRKPKPWKHSEPISREQLKQMRDEFWDTAPHYGGQKEIWDALRAAAEADLTLAKAIVDSAGVIVQTPDLTICYDERGAKYELPKYVLCEPTNLKHNS